MRRIEIKDLPEILGEDYLVLISNSDIDLSSLDRILNISGIITGLVDEYTYISNSKDLVSLLIKVDNDSLVHSNSMDRKVNDNLYVCRVEKYYEIIKSYKSKSESSNKFDLSNKIYGYNDIKVLMKLNKDQVNILILAPFTGSINISDVMFNSLSNMFRLVYGIDLVREDIIDSVSTFVLKLNIPLNILEIHGRRNFDILINQLLSVINIDKYTTLESIADSEKITNLLN